MLDPQGEAMRAKLKEALDAGHDLYHAILAAARLMGGCTCQNLPSRRPEALRAVTLADAATIRYRKALLSLAELPEVAARVAQEGKIH
jgi:hypothetical protein